MLSHSADSQLALATCVTNPSLTLFAAGGLLAVLVLEQGDWIPPNKS